MLTLLSLTEGYLVFSHFKAASNLLAGLVKVFADYIDLFTDLLGKLHNHIILHFVFIVEFELVKTLLICLQVLQHAL